MSLVVLVGPPGALVNEVAGELSQRHSWPYVATEEVIEKLTSATLDDLVIDHSDDDTRTWERDVAVALLGDVEVSDTRIIALGSGSLGNDLSDEFFAPVRERLARLRAEGARVVWLTADLTNLVKRNGLAGPRMAAVSSPRRIFYQQLTARAPLYEAVSDARVNTSNRDLATAADLVEECLA